MNIIKEPGKIILELSPPEEEIINYFVQTRHMGTAVLHEYFQHWMNGRKETMIAEQIEKLVRKELERGGLGTTDAS